MVNSRIRGLTSLIMLLTAPPIDFRGNFEYFPRRESDRSKISSKLEHSSSKKSRQKLDFNLWEAFHQNSQKEKSNLILELTKCRTLV